MKKLIVEDKTDIWLLIDDLTIENFISFVKLTFIPFIYLESLIE